MHKAVELNGKKYRCFYSISKGEKAPRENGQPLWPDIPEHIDYLQAIAYTPKGMCRVTSGRILEKLHKILTEGL